MIVHSGVITAYPIDGEPIHSLETPVEGLYIVPGMENTEEEGGLMDTYVLNVLGRIRAEWEEYGQNDLPKLVVPLNGGVLPFLFVIDGMLDRKGLNAGMLERVYGEDVDFSLDAMLAHYFDVDDHGVFKNIIFAAKEPDNRLKREGKFQLFGNPEADDRFLVLDDMADTFTALNGTTEAINRRLDHDSSEVTLMSVAAKMATLSSPEFERTEVSEVIPDIDGDIAPWIRGGVGLNSGNLTVENIEEAQESLWDKFPDGLSVGTGAALQRWSKAVYYQEGHDQVAEQDYVDIAGEIRWLSDPDNRYGLAEDSLFTVGLDAIDRISFGDAVSPLVLSQIIEDMRVGRVYYDVESGNWVNNPPPENVNSYMILGQLKILHEYLSMLATRLG